MKNKGLPRINKKMFINGINERKTWIIPFFHLQVAIHTLWNIRIMVLAKPEHENRISHIFSDSVKTGIANTLGTDITAPIRSVADDLGLAAVYSLFTLPCFFHPAQATRGQWACPSCSTAHLSALSTVTWHPEVRRSSGEVVSLLLWQPPRPSSHGGIWWPVGRVLIGWFDQKLAVADAVVGMLRLWRKCILLKFWCAASGLRPWSLKAMNLLIAKMAKS